MRVYLAGPLGFSEVGRAFHKDIVDVLTALNHEILDPWQLTPASKIEPVLQMHYGEPKRAAWAALNPEIGRNNATAIDSCDVVFAVLDGTDVDSGTASEIGYAYALGKRILGYRGDFRLSADNEGSIVNLQVEYFIRASGGKIFNKIEELPEAIQRISTGSSAICNIVPKSANHLAPEQAPVTKSISLDSSGAKLIIGILLALIVRAALEAVFKDPIQENAAWPPPLVWFQLLTFSVMMARFYLGATRYIDTQPQSHPLWISIVNVVFASLLFGAFYVAALAVGEDEFYAAIVTMHVVDAVWFSLGFLSLWISRPINAAGEIKTASNQKVMTIFFWLSVATIVWAGLLFSMSRFGILELITAKYWFLGGLIVLSIYDFVKLRDYYFRHSDWIARNSA